MKKIFALLVALICLCLISCNVQVRYSFMHSTNDISAVYVVTISFDEEDELTETELAEIEDIGEFLKDFRSLDCYEWFGDPCGPTEDYKEDTVVKICYNNGDYELINWCGRAKYFDEEERLRYYSGYNVFDEEPFELFLADYLED